MRSLLDTQIITIFVFTTFFSSNIRMNGKNTNLNEQKIKKVISTKTKDYSR